MNPEPDRNIEELNDEEIYAAIRYLELEPEREPHNGPITIKETNDNGVAVCVCLYIAVVGCLAVFWLYIR